MKPAFMELSDGRSLALHYIREVMPKQKNRPRTRGCYVYLVGDPEPIHVRNVSAMHIVGEVCTRCDPNLGEMPDDFYPDDEEEISQ